MSPFGDGHEFARTALFGCDGEADVPAWQSASMRLLQPLTKREYGSCESIEFVGESLVAARCTTLRDIVE